MIFAFAFAVAFAFALHLSFMILKAFKLKISQRQRKIRSPDPAILGRVRTRDPGPGHFGPDFDSGPATDPHLRIRSPRACLKSTDGGTTGTDFAFLNGLFDLNSIP